MRRLLAGFVVATVALGIGDLGATQASGPFVIVSDGTTVRGSFQPDGQPRDVANTIARLSVAAPRKDVRLKDGQIVTGFGFDGWTEGDRVRIVVTALLPADGTNRYVETKPGMRPSFRKQELAKLTLSPGEKRAVEEMKTLGIEPLIVQLETKSPFPDRLN